MENLINFDEHFQQVLMQWIAAESEKGRQPEELENEIQDRYEQFLKEPADWLDGVCPNDYFAKYTDAEKLVGLMLEYCKNGVSVPDLLLLRINELKATNQSALLNIISDNSNPEEAIMLAMDLLNQAESTAPMQMYINMQKNREAKDDIADKALECLQVMNVDVSSDLIKIFDEASDEGRDAMLDILAKPGCNESVFEHTLSRFKICTKSVAMYACYLARINDERALEPLKIRAEEPQTDYADYLEIRAAAERLGGKVIDRDYSQDPLYNALNDQ